MNNLVSYLIVLILNLLQKSVMLLQAISLTAITSLVIYLLLFLALIVTAFFGSVSLLLGMYSLFDIFILKKNCKKFCDAYQSSECDQCKMKPLSKMFLRSGIFFSLLGITLLVVEIILVKQIL